MKGTIMLAKDIKADGTTRYELSGFGLNGMTGVVLRRVYRDGNPNQWLVLGRVTRTGLEYEVTCSSREIIGEVAE